MDGGKQNQNTLYGILKELINIVLKYFVTAAYNNIYSDSGKKTQKQVNVFQI